MASRGEEVDLDDLFSSDTEDEATALAKASARVDDATRLKDEGNKLVQEGKISEACAVYKRGLGCIWALYRQPGAGTVAGAKDVGVAIDLNLSLCHVKLEEWESASRCASRALVVDAKNAKGLYRRGLANARLGLLDAAEEDLAKVVQVQPSFAEARRELQGVRQQLAEVKGTEAAIPRGFLESEGAHGEEGGHVVDAEHHGAREEEVPEEPQWVFGSQVEEALQEVEAYLSAIATRRIVCDSHEQLDKLRTQVASITSELLPKATTTIEAAIVDPPEEQPSAGLGGTYVEVVQLLDAMATGISSLRLGLVLQERTAGEFDAVRVCRELLPLGGHGASARSGKAPLRGYDVELVRWGDSRPPTEENFAEPLFPPTGQPPDAEAAAWQREVFHRVFQREASKYINAAAWMILWDLLQAGAHLLHDGREVKSLGLAHGLFFAGSVVEGPEAPCDSAAAIAAAASKACGGAAVRQADALALCGGRDRKAVLLPSFTSLGVSHKWLLLRVAARRTSGGDGNSAPEGRAGDADDADREVASDLCAGALGLLPRDGLVRQWDARPRDDRFVCRRVGWDGAAAHLAAAPDTGRNKGLQERVVASLLASAGIQVAAQEVFRATAQCRHDGAATQAMEEMDAAGRREVGCRLARAAAALGLPYQALEEALCDDGVPSDEILDATQQVAAGELVQRKLQAAGLVKLAGEVA